MKGKFKKWGTSTLKHQLLHPGSGPLWIDAGRTNLEELLPQAIDRKPNSGLNANCKPIFGHDPKPVNFFQDGSLNGGPQGPEAETLREKEAETLWEKGNPFQDETPTVNLSSDTILNL